MLNALVYCWSVQDISARSALPSTLSLTLENVPQPLGLSIGLQHTEYLRSLIRPPYKLWSCSNTIGITVYTLQQRLVHRRRSPLRVAAGDSGFLLPPVFQHRLFHHRRSPLRVTAGYSGVLYQPNAMHVLSWFCIQAFLLPLGVGSKVALEK